MPFPLGIFPDSSSIKQLPREQQIEVLNSLFEECPTLTSLILDNFFTDFSASSFESYFVLINSIREQLLYFLGAITHKTSTLSRLEKIERIQQVNEIIAAHPRLGVPKAQVDSLSDHSKSEQASLNDGNVELANKLATLNALYEETFPGLRYVVFVNGRSREIIMEDMKRRIERGDIEAEKREAFNVSEFTSLDRSLGIESISRSLALDNYNY